MAQNEMKAKPALPERVRSMEGLDRSFPRGEPSCLLSVLLMKFAVAPGGLLKDDAIVVMVLKGSAALMPVRIESRYLQKA